MRPRGAAEITREITRRSGEAEARAAPPHSVSLPSLNSKLPTHEELVEEMPPRRSPGGSYTRSQQGAGE